jgi:hypothetical protein
MCVDFSFAPCVLLMGGLPVLFVISNECVYALASTDVVPVADVTCPLEVVSGPSGVGVHATQLSNELAMMPMACCLWPRNGCSTISAVLPIGRAFLCSMQACSVRCGTALHGIVHNMLEDVADCFE